MHCKQCDVELTDFEATRRRIDNGEYPDLCNLCWLSISGMVRAHERWDLYEPSPGDEADSESYEDTNIERETGISFEEWERGNGDGRHE